MIEPKIIKSKADREFFAKYILENDIVKHCGFKYYTIPAVEEIFEKMIEALKKSYICDDCSNEIGIIISDLKNEILDFAPKS